MLMCLMEISRGSPNNCFEIFLHLQKYHSVCVNAAAIPVNRIPPLGLGIAVPNEAVAHVVHALSLATGISSLEQTCIITCSQNKWLFGNSEVPSEVRVNQCLDLAALLPLLKMVQV